mmetsp:Transcript_12068/g.31577  ORF Transcript_12068/g.31577 Transcript_12068/m.31577 type:complete len:222 (+) Transcript_12068:405-1070(+)
MRGAGLEAESGNVRADGFFSVQVIALALQNLGLACTPIGAESVRDASRAPHKEVGYICNRSEHWFPIRRLGAYWFDLNSMLPSPRLLTDSQLASALEQLGASGYSVFVVRGAFPAVALESQPERLRAAAEACRDGGGGGGGAVARPGAPPDFNAFSGQGYSLSAAPATPALPDNIAELQRTDPELAAALVASLGDQPAAQPAKTAEESAEEMRRKRLARFG